MLALLRCHRARPLKPLMMRMSSSGSSSGTIISNGSGSGSSGTINSTINSNGSGSSGTINSRSSGEGFLQGSAAAYVDAMYAAWQQDRTSVHVSWQAYFASVHSGAPPGHAFHAPPTLIPAAVGDALMADHPAASLSSASPHAPADVIDHLKVQMLVRAYQVRGHQLATLDPLAMHNHQDMHNQSPELNLSTYGFTDADLDRSFFIGPAMLPGFASPAAKSMTLREIYQALQDTYCGTIGIEYTHIPDRAQCDWLRARVEVPKRFVYSVDEKRMILDRLVWSDSFERFVAAKWSSEKRFGLEGCEALIPGMKALIDHSVEKGIESIVFGMPHRGRLNVLSNVVRKPNESIFYEFSGHMAPGMEGSGDVKYHLGANYVRPTPSGKRVHLSLVANPSHLEAVNPVVEGKVRATQFYTGDEEEQKRSMAVLLHGDAAFAAQGVVFETLGFCDLPSYSTGGTIHIIVNNQIGFTTDPSFNRSTSYCTDVAKTVNAPILHVNGDDVESVVFACQLAAEWRQTFKKDVVVDIVCYRRHGHNEVDQPSFTQPLMYKRIAKMTPVLEKYSQQLIKDGTFTSEEIEANKKKVWGMLEESYKKSKDYQPQPNVDEWVSTSWKGIKNLKELAEQVTPIYDTGVAVNVLKHIGQTISTTPPQFNLHSNLARILKARRKTIDEGEGRHVRLSGQDVERGTFSHRHAVLHDQATDQHYVALNNLAKEQARFSVSNSSLSEFGVLGFELGYSLVDPNSLILWEAQFGDFSNNAQCIIDQFIASGERKWKQRTGLVMLLPHGYDGAGPEHSSARLERFLQLCDDKPYEFPVMDPTQRRQIQDCNMQVVYASTPANYFHVLRRQIHRDFRKPLIMMTSKSLLRHPLCRSSLAEMGPESRFKRLISDTTPVGSQDPAKVKKVIFCTGQVYYALLRAREANQIDDCALLRVEQISPFPFDLVLQEVDKYPNASVVWAQEEPMNMGSWDYVDPRIETALSKSVNHRGRRPQYAGREPLASVATGNKKMHEMEENALLSAALTGNILKPKKYVNGVPLWS